MQTTVDVKNFTRSNPGQSIPFQTIAESVLPGWEISLVFAGTIRAQSLNVTLRNKSYIPNVLSYVSGKKSGEIIICPIIARKQAPEYNLSYPEFIAYLFIHGLLHLKGHPHGATMERLERELLARHLSKTTFYTNGTKNSNRH